MSSPWLSPEETTYQDWETFVDDHPLENTVLEYKDVRVFESGSGSRKLVQDISAMVNTHGGLMLLGVTGKDGSYAVGGFERSDNPPGTLRDRVINQCLDMTWPPLFVQPLEIESADGTRVVVAMRLDPRLETPTFFHSEGERGCFECYVRADGRKYQPKGTGESREWLTNIDLATDLPELQGRAEKAAATREEMLRLSRDRLSIWLAQVGRELSPKTTAAGTRFEMVACPLFPRGVLTTRTNIRSYVQQWHRLFVSAHRSWFDTTDTLTRCESMGGGERFVSIERTPPERYPRHWLYAEATDMGMIFCTLGLPGRIWPDGEKTRIQDTNSASASALCQTAAGTLDLASIVYKGTQYPGPLLLRFEMGPGLETFALIDLSGRLCTHSTWHYDAQIRSATGADFWTAAGEAVGGALEDLAWTFRSSDNVMREISKWVAQFVGPS